MAEGYASAPGFSGGAKHYVDTSSTNDHYIKATSGKYLAVRSGVLALSDLGYGWTLDSGTTGESNTIQDPNTNKYIVIDSNNNDSLTLSTSSTNGDWKGLKTDSNGGDVTNASRGKSLQVGNTKKWYASTSP